MFPIPRIRPGKRRIQRRAAAAIAALAIVLPNVAWPYTLDELLLLPFDKLLVLRITHGRVLPAAQGSHDAR